MSKIRVGIVGTGKATCISVGHLNGILLSDNAELAAIHNRSWDPMLSWCEANNVDASLCCRTFDEFLEKVDAVCVATPNNSHADYVIRCLEAGKHVFVEKPLGNCIEDAQRIRRAMAESDRIGYVNLCYRRIPAIRMLHDYIASGKAGRIYTVRFNMGAPRLANEAVPLEWRFQRAVSGPGAIGDFGSHAIDLLHYVLGKEDSSFKKVYAISETFIKERVKDGVMMPVENDDATMVLAQLGNGALYSLLVCRTGSTPSQFEIVAEKAIIRYSLTDTDKIFVQERETNGYFGPVKECVASDCREIWHGLPFFKAPTEATAENVVEFIKTIESGTDPEIGLEYGCRLLEEVEEIEQRAGK